MSEQSSLGPYQLIQELGRGSHSVVYKAWQSSLERPVALKILSRYDPDTLQKFRAEARLSARLKSPGIRRIYAAEQMPGGHIYVVMEYVDQSLKDLLRKRQAQKQAFSPEEISRLLTPIAEALDDIHRQGLVHLDIKPENILVSKDGYALLADFGIARQRGAQTQEGTPLYMSPEQAAGNRPVGPWSDVYSLGVLIYELVAGRPPFLGKRDIVLIRQHLEEEPPPPRQFKPHLDRDLERTLLAALSKNPQQRPVSASALLQAIRKQRPTPVSVALKRTGHVIRNTTDTIRRRPQLALIPAVLIMLVAVLTLAFGRRPDSNGPTPTSSPGLTAIPTPSATSSIHITPIETTKAPPEPIPAPTLTIEPSSTPARLTATAISPQPPVTSMPSPELGLLEPSKGVEIKDTTVNFVWQGRLISNQFFIVTLHHIESDWTEQSEALTRPSWIVTLPAERYGRWDWQVQIVHGGTIVVKSEKWHFYLNPYGGNKFKRPH